jgi:hypothetical protein
MPKQARIDLPPVMTFAKGGCSMKSAPSSGSKVSHPSTKPGKGRLLSKSHLNVELLEERALLATGLGLVAGLTDSSNALLTTGFYYDLLHRAPGTSEVANWTAALQAGMSPQQEAIGFLTSPEYYSDLVNSDYWNLLQRGPSSAELNSWVSDLQSGVSQQQVEVSFLTSSEYYQLQGSTATQWLASLYQKVLDRSGTLGELADWNQVLLGGSSLSAIATEFVTSGEADALQVNSAYQQLLSRGAQPAEVAGWVGAMQNGLTLSELNAEIVSSPEYLADQTLTPVTPAEFNVTSNPGLHFEFAPEYSNVAPGYTKVPVVAYSAAPGYGWSDITGLGTEGQISTDPLTSNFVTGTDGTFLVDLPNGGYTVTLSLGDAEQAHDDVSVWANGSLLASGLNNSPGQFTQSTFEVQVTNGQLALQIASMGTVNATFALDALDIVSEYPAALTSVGLTNWTCVYNPNLTLPVSQVIGPNCISTPLSYTAPWDGTSFPPTAADIAAFSTSPSGLSIDYSQATANTFLGAYTMDSAFNGNAWGSPVYIEATITIPDYVVTPNNPVDFGFWATSAQAFNPATGGVPSPSGYPLAYNRAEFDIIEIHSAPGGPNGVVQAATALHTNTNGAGPSGPDTTPGYDPVIASQPTLWNTPVTWGGLWGDGTAGTSDNSQVFLNNANFFTGATPSQWTNPAPYGPPTQFVAFSVGMLGPALPAGTTYNFTYLVNSVSVWKPPS